MPQLHVIDDVKQDMSIFTDKKISLMNCRPRPSPKVLGDRNKLRTPWKWECSVFKHFRADDERLLNKCFELDWSRTKIPRLIKDEAERTAVKELLRKNYRWFRESYKWVAGIDP